MDKLTVQHPKISDDALKISEDIVFCLSSIRIVFYQQKIIAKKQYYL